MNLETIILSSYPAKKRISQKKLSEYFVIGLALPVLFSIVYLKTSFRPSASTLGNMIVLFPFMFSIIWFSYFIFLIAKHRRSFSQVNDIVQKTKAKDPLILSILAKFDQKTAILNSNYFETQKLHTFYFAPGYVFIDSDLLPLLTIIPTQNIKQIEVSRRHAGGSGSPIIWSIDIHYQDIYNHPAVVNLAIADSLDHNSQGLKAIQKLLSFTSKIKVHHIQMFVGEPSPTEILKKYFNLDTSKLTN